MVLAMGFAPAPQNRIRATVQIPTTTGLTSLTSGSAPSSSGKLDYIISACALTPGMALTRIQDQLQTDLYLGQVQLIACSSHLSAGQFRLLEDYLTRLGPLDKTAYIIATPSVRKLFHIEPKVGGLPILDLIGGFSCQGCETIMYRQHQWDVETALPTAGDSVWMPYVTVTPTGFNTGRILVYRHCTPVWALSPHDSMLLGLILGITAKGYVNFVMQHDILGIRTLTSHSSVYPFVRANRLYLRFGLAVSGTLDSWNGPPVTVARLGSIDSQVAHYLAPQILTVLKRLQRQGVAPEGWLAPLIWRSYPSWHSPSVWEAHYRKAVLIVHVHFRITNVGDTE
ncbi:MAG: hypothetical protein C7B45_09100 [Sulfobacillus acidophilus]|uniref:Spore germination protein N-terminal domain-containing protein n=1 Tax=Sulfobacillus acidophilus TaxID=53633 RepID=A0A2T2WHX2_9FIRM|nr:MAG: hypothetical protein C7B45_09100 [Sulfobacillus acidophilus]